MFRCLILQEACRYYEAQDFHRNDVELEVHTCMRLCLIYMHVYVYVYARFAMIYINIQATDSDHSQ